jgi:hypothetical protein
MFYNDFTNKFKGLSMKITKLSLIAALAVTSAVAGEGKIGGDAKLFYWTDDIGTHDLFNKNGAAGDAAVSLDYSRDIIDGVTVNAGITGISTLGLENTLVSGTNVTHGGARTAAGVDDKVWIDTANIVLKPIDKTMLVIGRQTLDTPLAFTETWNIAHNTFDAAVAVDNHIENTTLVAAWVGRGNGHNGFENVDGGQSKYGALNNAQETVLAKNEGAFAVAAITKAIPMTTAQVWFYNVRNEADAVWLQADVDASKEVSVGLQYSKISPKGVVAGKDDTTAFAGKLGYTANDLTLTGAYSEVDDKGLVYMGNTATGGAHAGQSKLYTEAWWNYGFVGQAGAKSGMISAALGDYTAQYTTVSNDNNLEMDEITLTATKKVGPVEATVALINTSTDDNSLDGNAIQAYLTVPFSL